MEYFQPSAQQQEMLTRVKALCEEWMPFISKWDREDKAPLLDMLKTAGKYQLTGLMVPKQYGGLDLNAIDYALAVELMTSISKSWLPSEAFFRTSGPCPAIIIAAENEACRAKFLPDIVAGRKAGTIALTEPLHGSDMSDLETTATEDGNYFILNGSKRFITGATEDDIYATFVRFKNIPGSKGVGAIIVEKGLPGFRMEKGPEFMGARATPHGNLFFEDCRVPKENLVLREGNFARLMRAFNIERLHNSAVSVGLGQGAYDEAVAYIRKRKQFGRPIMEFQSIYHSIAEMHMELEGARLLMLKAALTAVDGKFPRALEVSVAKTVANRTGRNVCFKAMQLHGGDGVTMDYPVQQAYRDVVVASYGGGLPTVLNNIIAGALLGEKFDQHK